jgi:acyl-CoA hydrolase
MKVHPSTTRVEALHVVLPTHTNTHGTAFGGQLAAWIDIAAAVSAGRFCKRPVVTASIDELHFLEPIEHGMIVVLQAQVNMAWSTSMEVGVRVEAENPTTGERLHCCSAYLTFVAQDEKGHPCRVPELDTGGDERLERRAREGQGRRDHRLKMRAQRLAERDS